MKTQNKKRGFTIVELVIVIAVIAILSAVLIPTFAGIVKKSRQSADETAVRNMNTILAADGAVEPTTLEDLYSVLAENGIDAEDYKPLQNDTFFFWDSEQNVVVYTDANYNVTYPADQVENVNHAAWISLSGEIREDYKGVEFDEEKTTATVSSAEEFYALVNAINDEKREVRNVATIVLPEGELLFKGANVAIVGETTQNQLWETLTIKTGGVSTTLVGIANLGAVRTGFNDNGTGIARNYCGGLIGMTHGTDVKFQGINLKNCTFGSDTTDMVGAFVGHVEDGSLTITGCDMENVTINGLMKVGAYVGQLSQGATLTIAGDCTAENVAVNAKVGFAGKLIGLAINLSTGGSAPTGAVAVNGGAARFDDAITVNLVKDSAVKYITIDGKEYATDMEVENGKVSIAQPEEYVACVSKYGFVAVYGDSEADYAGGKVNIKYHAVAELTF